MKSVLVTGCSTGIGRATALHLHSLGFRVYAGVRKTEDGDRLQEAGSNRMQPVILDVTDRASIDDCARRIAGDAGDGLWGLVNNAGVSVYGPMECVPLDDLRHQFEVNVTGQIAVTQALLPKIREARGRVVFVGSVAGRAPAFPFFGPYTASKWAVEALADALRVELASSGVLVALVEPGAIESRIWSKGYESFEDELARYPRELREVYEPAMRRGLRLVHLLEQRGRPADIVARRIEHALTARRPRTRYLVGPDAKARAWGESRLPHRIRDRVVKFVLRSS
jgi:NAD(P)-dependent dehydrogenase (short-subunit alcohol dehydrogenase family)